MTELSVFQQVCLFLPLVAVPLWFWLRWRERGKDRDR
jgi:hypothetical protein